MHRWPHQAGCLLLAFITLAMSGCATTLPQADYDSRPFEFKHDALSFANELDWIYRLNPQTNKMDFTRVQPEPEYIHHCFAVVRTAKQFFLHASFDAAQPKADEATYRKLVKQVMARSARDITADPQRVVIPGYADLRQFSTAWTAILKDATGGAWHSYLQSGNWRMVFPFSRGDQQDTAEQLLAEVKANWPPIVHVVHFPIITINHAVLIYAARETDKEIVFTIYDPNHPERPGELSFDRASRTFIFPATDYFADGPVDVYEVYRGIM